MKKQNSNTYNRSAFDNNVSSVLHDLAIDVAAMCGLDASTLNTKSNQSAKSDGLVGQTSSKNPFTANLQPYREVASKLGLSNQQIEKESKQIWNLMPPKYQCYLRDTCQPNAHNSIKKRAQVECRK